MRSLNGEKITKTKKRNEKKLLEKKIMNHPRKF
jgi:hypothetical protein